MEIVLKGIVVAFFSVGAGWLARRGHGNIAALMVSLPVFSLGALWVAAGQGAQALENPSWKSLLAIPVWILYMLSVWGLAKYSGLDPNLCILLGLIVWTLAALGYLWLS